MTIRYTISNNSSQLLNTGGGVTSYEDLTSKPSINSVELDGNKTASDLGLVSATNFIPLP